ETTGESPAMRSSFGERRSMGVPASCGSRLKVIACSSIAFRLLLTAPMAAKSAMMAVSAAIPGAWAGAGADGVDQHAGRDLAQRPPLRHQLVEEAVAAIGGDRQDLQARPLEEQGIVVGGVLDAGGAHQDDIRLRRPRGLDQPGLLARRALRDLADDVDIVIG